MTNSATRAWAELAQRLSVTLSDDAAEVVAALHHVPNVEVTTRLQVFEGMDATLARKILRTIQRAVDRGDPIHTIPPKLAALRSDHNARKQLSLDPDDDTYSRVKSFRKGVRQTVFDMNKGLDGLVRDPLTGQVIYPDQNWHMGHKPGHEFWKARDHALRIGMSREEFLDQQNDPNIYRPELPESNCSHMGEDLTAAYLGA
ncbi:HNH/ENDO VII family nuclease [Nocardia gamkensis]|uniref:HNH/ENDO VII family nuclease n=1 Tax=Nocardia gamkensis TaxID=352869 RepID=UPI0036E1D724